MTLLTDDERRKGLKEITSADGTILLGSDVDLDYFKDKLAKMVLRGATNEATLKLRKQIELLEELEDAVVIYHEQRPPEHE